MNGLLHDSLTQFYLEEYINLYGLTTAGHLTMIMNNVGFDDRRIKRYHNALRNTAKYDGTINYDRELNHYYASNFVDANEKRTKNMLKVQWVLIDFLGRIETHSPVLSKYTPTYAWMMLEDRSYEIVYAESGSENYLDNQLLSLRAEFAYTLDSEFMKQILSDKERAILNAPKYIVVLDNWDNAGIITSKQIAYFCVLDEEMKPMYLKPEEVVQLQLADA